MIRDSRVPDPLKEYVDMPKKIPSSPFHRVRKLIGLSSNVIAQEVKNRISEKLNRTPSLQGRINQAEDIVRTLGELKGAAMKAGQLLSMEFSEFLPPEVIAVLRQLHDQSATYTGESMSAIVLKELGKDRFAQLHDFSETPIAAASIGQVHTATLEGRPIVIKIQYPGIATSIDNDMSVIQKMIDLVLKINGKTINLTPFYQELHQGLKDEADYLLEAVSLARYHELFDGNDFTVPEVIKSFSTVRVLSMSKVEGTRLTEWIAANKQKPEAKLWLGNKVLRLLINEFFVNGIVQTDPNFGNFLIDEKSNKMVLLDCGAVRLFSNEFRRNIRALANIATDFETTPVVEKMIELDMLNPNESPEVKTLLAELVIDVMALFAKENQPVYFGDIDFINDLRKRAFDIVRLVRYSGPARQVIFLNRKLGGMFHLLKEMQVVMDIYPFWKEVMGLDLKDENETKQHTTC
jgi:aarF domain-containing kinase